MLFGFTTEHTEDRHWYLTARTRCLHASWFTLCSSRCPFSLCFRSLVNVTWNAEVSQPDRDFLACFFFVFFFAIIPTTVSVLHMGPVVKCGEQGHEACKDISIMLLLWDTALLGKQEMYGRNHSNSRDYLVFQLRWLCECQVGTTHTKFLVDMLLTLRFVANRSCRVDQDNSDVSFHFSAMHFPGASRGFCFAQQSTNSFGT